MNLSTYDLWQKRREHLFLTIAEAQKLCSRMVKELELSSASRGNPTIPLSPIPIPFHTILVIRGRETTTRLATFYQKHPKNNGQALIVLNSPRVETLLHEIAHWNIHDHSPRFHERLGMIKKLYYDKVTSGEWVEQVTEYDPEEFVTKAEMAASKVTITEV